MLIQHGGNDVSCKRSELSIWYIFSMETKAGSTRIHAIFYKGILASNNGDADDDALQKEYLYFTLECQTV